MKLITDLGIIKDKKGRGRRRGIYECPVCLEPTEVISSAVKSGQTKQCSSCRYKHTTEARIKHGKCYTKLYKVFSGMKDRCYNSKNPHFHNYGGRGISICQEWLNNYTSFDKWALSNGYAEGLTIERVNNNEGYSPENCIWDTKQNQLMNTRRNLQNKLSQEDINLIKTIPHNPAVTKKSIAIELGISPHSINKILSGERRV